jgi:exo-1,4-beta-D-glucosaminidase
MIGMMRKKFLVITFTIALLFGWTISGYSQNSSWNIKNQKLRKGWKIQSTQNLRIKGEIVSKRTYDPKGWFPAKVPATVLGTLLQDDKYQIIYHKKDLSGIPHYKNIYYGRNLAKIPPYQYNVPWWYRTTFHLNKAASERTIRLRFDGINYRADVWLNGHKIASSDTLAGAFRRYTLNITPYVTSGKNVLALKVKRPRSGELTLGFMDWNPYPPDHDMGIWRPVHLLVSGPVSIDHPFVQTKVDTVSLNHAKLTISTLVHNYSKNTVQGMLKGTISGHGKPIHFSKKVSLQPNKAKKITFSPNQYSQLSMDHPKLWWTRNLGTPNLYKLQLQFTTDSKPSDEKKMHFGIRSVSDYMTKDGFRGFKLNGKKVLIKGGGWTDRMLLDASRDYEKAGIDYAVQMNLNAIRMEGFWGENQHLYNLADKNGILVQVGFSAQWEWTHEIGSPADTNRYGGVQSPAQITMAAKSFKDQIIWLRNHPSIFVWMYGSDKYPRPDLEKKYLSSLKKYDPTRPALSSAKEHTSKITGPSAVKMRGPYDYVPPDYWYIDTQNGGAFGYNTETGPGPEVPVLESLKKMIPADSLWPISESWLYHAARGNFHNMTHYNIAMNKRLGKPTGLRDYERKAQYLNYEGMRAMYEAFEANRFKATGIIQWMYNASWPKLWWQLYDFYLMPTGAFYGAQKANQPLHISYNYGKNAIDVMNNTGEDAHSLSAEINILNFNLKPVLQKTVQVSSLPERKTKQVLQLPDDMDLSKTYFVDLKLHNKKEKVISSNFYALSTQKDKLNEAKSTWFITPQSQFADLKMLQQLPNIQLNIEKHFSQRNDSTFARITLKNPSSHLAFMVHLDLRKKKSGDSVVPIFWEDNYISLLPGEKRIITGYCHTKDLDGQRPTVTIDGWNVK